MYLAEENMAKDVNNRLNLQAKIVATWRQSIISVSGVAINALRRRRRRE